MACFLVANAFAASQVYYIEARGEFGKELAEMAMSMKIQDAIKIIEF